MALRRRLLRARFVALALTALRTWRGRAITVVACAVLLGAAGAAVGSDDGPPGYNAEAVIRVDPTWPEVADRPAIRKSRLAYLEAVSRSAPVIQAAARQAGREPQDVADTTDAKIASDGSIRISTRAEVSALAVAQATAVAVQTVSAAVINMRSATSRVALIGDFEAGHSLWSPTASASAFPVADLQTVRGSASPKGHGHLRVSCRADVGCGVRTDVSALFRAGTTYEIAAWVRARRAGIEATLLAGIPNSHQSVSISTNVSRVWRRVAARWTPEITTSIATVAIEFAAAGSISVDVDAVSVVGAAGVPRPTLPRPLDAAVESGASEMGRYATIERGISRGESGRAPLRATLAGVAGGAIIGLSAILGAALARRRRVGVVSRSP